MRSPRTKAEVSKLLRQYALGQNIEERWKLRFRGGTTITLASHPRGKVFIRMLQTPYHNRNRGYGRNAISQVCRWADSKNVTLQLHCAPCDCDMRFERLQAFYESLGFESHERSKSLMERLPNRLTPIYE